MLGGLDFLGGRHGHVKALVICAGGTWMTTGRKRCTGNGAGLEGVRKGENFKIG